MINLVDVLHDPSGIVSKLIFEDETAICEAVAYKYENRGVVCFSVQSGCKVGCVFCGTGKRFLRDLTTDEMDYQVTEALRVIGNKPRIQLMSMSMGEPADNWKNLEEFVEPILEAGKMDVLISSVGLNDAEVLIDWLILGRIYKRFGLQFSLHSICGASRKNLLGDYDRLLSLSRLLNYGRVWTEHTGKRCYWNYICTGKENDEYADDMAVLLEGMHLTCSVMCSPRKLGRGDVAPAQRFANMVLAQNKDVEVSVFGPAGQDTIGGGCGQLCYVQSKLNPV